MNKKEKKLEKLIDKAYKQMDKSLDYSRYEKRIGCS